MQRERETESFLHAKNSNVNDYPKRYTRIRFFSFLFLFLVIITYSSYGGFKKKEISPRVRYEHKKTSLEKDILPFSLSSKYVFENTETNFAFTTESFSEIYKRSSYSKNSKLGDLQEYNSSAVELSFLITGVGRSGTTFLVDQFKSLNIKISHDNVMDYPLKLKGSASWPNAFNEKYCPREGWNFGKVKIIRYKHIFQVIRDPLKQINSRADGGNYIYRYYVSNICNTDLFKGFEINEKSYDGKMKQFKSLVRKSGLSDFEASLKVALRHWVLHNSFVSSYSEFTFRTEDLKDIQQKETILKYVIEKSELENRPTEKTWQKFRDRKVDEHVNSGLTKKKEGFELTWDALEKVDPEFTLMARIMSIRFGYLTDENEIKQIQESKKINGLVKYYHYSFLLNFRFFVLVLQSIEYMVQEIDLEYFSVWINKKENC
eukprot:snap_masked-scaffold_80-processed-gene-0.35-mRNA-1 protein AED:1.00 eAED:1.00 QI:0/0/0/0/1/1/4/0/431